MEAAKTEPEHEHEPVDEETSPQSEEPGPTEPTPEVAPDEAEEEHEEAEVAEPEPEPEQGYSEADLEAMRGRLDKEATRHSNRLSEIMGEMASLLVPCELCTSELAGFHWPIADEAARDELHGRLLDVLRNPAEAPLAESPRTETCPDCNGWGKVLSGSLVADHKRIACATCKGLGYTDKPGWHGETSGAATVHPLPTPAPDVDTHPPDADAFGSPRLLPDGQENPNYGKMPQYKNPDLP